MTTRAIVRLHRRCTRTGNIGLTTALLVCAAILTSADQTHAATILFGSDADFIFYQNSTLFVKDYGGNVRWGNGAANGDWEYAIVNGSDTPIGAVGQATWSSTVPNTHEVVFAYDGSGSSMLTLSGVGTMTRSVPIDSNAIFVRVKDSSSPFTSLSSISIDLSDNGAGDDYTFSLLTGDANAEYWGVIDPRLSQGFVIRATASLQGPKTAGSNPMYQFKVGTAQLPVPSTLALLLASIPGGIVSGLYRRKRQASA